MKKFIFKFWIRISEKEHKTLTLEVEPSVWPDEDIPNGYVFFQGGAFNIFINGYKVIEKDSSIDWEKYFEIYVSQALRLEVSSGYYSLCMNLPEPVQDPEVVQD